MKKILGIIGIGLITGVTVYALLSKTKKTKVNINIRHEKNPGDVSSANTVSIINRNDIHSEHDGLEDVKDSAVGTMSARHKEASNIIKDAVDIISSKTEIPADENRDLDQLSDELDKLLNEE